jgi:FtsH-binding integral membrane protein
VIEILLRVAGIFAVVFIMYGGFQYLTSQAEPDKVNKAKHTIINALVGLIIAILASVIINFIARSIT